MSRFLEVLLAVSLTLIGCDPAESDGGDERKADTVPPGNPDPTPAPPSESGTDTGTETATNTSPVTSLRGVVSKNASYRVDVEWVQGPDFENEDNQVRLLFFTTGGKAASAVVLDDFHPWMTSMGHGAPTIDIEWQTQDAATPHIIVVKGLMFTMGGPWDLMIEATVDGTADKAAFPVDIPK